MFVTNVYYITNGRVMNYPVLLLVPILFVAARYLSVTGEKIAKLLYRRHVKIKKTSSSEIGVESDFMNTKFIILVVVITLLSIVISEYLLTSIGGFEEFLFGFFVILLLIQIGISLSNIFIFLYTAKNPHLIEGTIKLNPILAYKIHQYHIMYFIVPFIGISIYVNSFFLYGGIASVLLQYVAIYRSIKKEKNLAVIDF